MKLIWLIQKSERVCTSENDIAFATIKYTLGMTDHWNNDFWYIKPSDFSVRVIIDNNVRYISNLRLDIQMVRRTKYSNIY